MSSYASIEDIAHSFERKTAEILERYGPGPRVHYHVGLIDDAPPTGATAEDLRRRLVDAQERLLSRAAEVWDAASTLRGEVLDVGCGLGGGAIFWAQEFGATVTAVTCVPSHVDWVARFAAVAGVASRVRPVLCDATQVPGENRFDAAVAFDSSCYLPRNEWFRRLAALLRPGGRVFIMDLFMARPGYDSLPNSHWKIRLGTIDEYVAAGREAGFTVGEIEDISDRTQHFWSATLGLMQLEAQQRRLSPDEAVRQQASMRVHAMVRQSLAEGGLRNALMSFVKTEG